MGIKDSTGIGNGSNPWTSLNGTHDVMLNVDTGKILVHDGTSTSWSHLHQPTSEQVMEMDNLRRKMEDSYRREQEIEATKHREKLDAIKSFFPRGHAQIQHLDVMLDIAREDQLNPLYEQVLKEFDEAKLTMSRAANKLASAVKLTDSEEIEKRTKIDTDAFARNMTMGLVGSGINSSTGYLPGSLNQKMTTFSSGTYSIPTASMVGPTGAVGMTGPKGDKGDPGIDGKDGRDGLSTWESFKRWVRNL